MNSVFLLADTVRKLYHNYITKNAKKINLRHHKTKKLCELCVNINKTTNQMLLFNITFNIETRIHEQWLKWTKTNFLPAVKATNLPKSCKILKLLTEVENGGNTYTVQLNFDSMETYMSFELNHKEQLLDRHNMLFRGKFVLFSSLLEEV